MRSYPRYEDFITQTSAEKILHEQKSVIRAVNALAEGMDQVFKQLNSQMAAITELGKALILILDVLEKRKEG